MTAVLDTFQQGAEENRARQPRLVGISARAGAVAVVSVGLFLRIWILGRNPWSSSTAIPGLMAREILHGHFSAFYWGQSYGGVEPYVVAAMFALFGQSNFTLGLTPIVLDAIAAVLVWRIGRRLFGSKVGMGAALLFWIWPEVYIFDSTLEYGFRFVTLVCGLAVMLIAIRIAQRREPVRLPRSFSSPTVEAPSQSAVVRHLDWLALGLFAGIGWWSSPEVVYYLVPSVVFLGWRLLKRRIELRPGFLVLAVVGAVVGALPWLWANVPSHLGSLRNMQRQRHRILFEPSLDLFHAYRSDCAWSAPHGKLRQRPTSVRSRIRGIPGRYVRADLGHAHRRDGVRGSFGRSPHVDSGADPP